MRQGMKRYLVNSIRNQEKIDSSGEAEVYSFTFIRSIKSDYYEIPRLLRW